MPLTKAMDHRSGLVRRFSSRRPSQYVGFEDSDAADFTGDYMSMAGSDRTGESGGEFTGAENLVWELDDNQQRMKAFNEFANRTLMPDEKDLMLKKFEKADDVEFERTYELGKPVSEISQPTSAPHVAIVLLPGADLPEVNRLEQFGMLNDKPDQRDAGWRVTTAGEMLSNISVTGDLQLSTKDVTSQVAANVLARMIKESQNTRQYRSHSRIAVTIQSENVEIVHDFSQANKAIDLSATLIEVNVSSLFILMTDYKQIILKSGPQMTAPKAKQLLDRMIEAARQFCVRSPILFRMSTRRKIINSNNTRYGVDSEQSFRTFTTSNGIKEIIMMSASYFLALDPSAPGMDNYTQRVIRPRYLQMLTLLLSLLNDDDLQATAAFLEKTYGIIPRRPDMELLFLKVIPLTSINSNVFLQGLIPAVHQWRLPERALQNESHVWAEFIKRLAKQGYLLPGTVDDLGHAYRSWVYAWPEQGIHSSTVFSRLQYHGETSFTFNEIPTARFSFEPDLKELTVIMTDDTTYTINPKDYEQISTLSKGLYTLSKCDDNSICDLEVRETVLNNSINEAITIVNNAIKVFNSQAAPYSKGGRALSVLKRGSGYPIVYRDIEPSVRLTRNEARLNGDILAVAYKQNGRNVPKIVAMRQLAYENKRVEALFNRICRAAGEKNLFHYRSYIEGVNQLLSADKHTRNVEMREMPISDAPIAQALGPEDTDVPAKKIWFEYHVDVVEDLRYEQELLQLQAKAAFVTEVQWRHVGQQAEIKLADVPTRLFVAPLQPVSEAQQDDEICVGDLALLVGKYVVIAMPQNTPNGPDYTLPCIMTNWLEITDSYAEEVGRRRGRNFQAKERLPVTRFL